ncbi:MAG: uL15 family ribosomal protein [Candidatus Thorarchaeota archaeon]
MHKRIRKMRGRRESGYGSAKGHRAAGQRGGRGNAGSEKHLKMKYLKANPRYFGKWGFKPLQRNITNVETMNVGELDSLLPRLLERGIATKDGDRYAVDVSKLSIDKILGGGRVTHALDLKGVKAVSGSAREKILSAGGTIDVPASAE